jgi:hypothetical protein
VDLLLPRRLAKLVRRRADGELVPHAVRNSDGLLRRQRVQLVQSVLHPELGADHLRRYVMRVGTCAWVLGQRGMRQQGHDRGDHDRPFESDQAVPSIVVNDTFSSGTEGMSSG